VTLSPIPDLSVPQHLGLRTADPPFSTHTFCLPAQVCLGAALGISKPSALLWFKSDLFTYALGFLMLSMGLTLTFDDFRQVPPCNARTAATPCLLPIPRTGPTPVCLACAHLSDSERGLHLCKRRRSRHQQVLLSRATAGTAGKLPLQV